MSELSPKGEARDMELALTGPPREPSRQAGRVGKGAAAE